MVKFPPVPAEVKPIAHLLKLAEEHEERNIVVTYWARMGACLLALRLVPKQKSAETAELIRQILDWLEQAKKANADNDGITNETTAQALIEEYALKVFASADAQDRAENFNKNTIKLFYTTGMLMDVLDQFGELSEDLREKRKYAKWKAAYIHNCLKSGETPLPGPPQDLDGPSPVVPNSMVSEDELKTYTNFRDKDPNSAPSTPSAQMPPNNFMYLPSKPTVDDVSSMPPDMSIFNTPAPEPFKPLAPEPFTPPAPVVTPAPPPAVRSSSAPVDGQYVPTPEHIQKAQKFCKFAASALNYDDVKNALDYIHKAMNLLELGKEEQ